MLYKIENFHILYFIKKKYKNKIARDVEKQFSYFEQNKNLPC